MRVGFSRRAVATFVALVTVTLLAATIAPSAAAAPLEGNATAATTTTNGSVEAGRVQTDTTIDTTTTLALTPDRPGSVRATLRFDIPVQVTSMRITLPEDASVTGADGFERTDEGYEWTGADAPSLTYDLSANRSNRAEGPLTGEGQYSFVDAGPWAIVRKPGFGLSGQFRGSGDVTVDRTVETAGSGAVGDTMVYLGPYDSHTRRAHGQRFRLIVPATAEMAAGPDAVLASLANASDELRVGDRDDQVFGIAAPTAAVGWGARGLQTGDTDFWVRDVETLDTPENVWLHEYVHTRQSFAGQADPSARWLTEATANYYAALLTLEAGNTGFGPFSRELARGTGDRYERTVLAEPDTWARHADYEKGALVTGELDRRLRLATGRTNSFENVFAQLNSAEGAVDRDRLRTAMATVANETVAARLDALVSTDRSPSMWERTQHRVAFGPTPPLIRTTVPTPATDYRVSGPYRNRSTERPPTLVPNETVAFDVSITNRGGTSGAYDFPVRVNGTTIATLSGTVAGRNTTTGTVEYTVDSPGQRVVTVDGTAVGLSTVDPARATVTEVRTAPASPTAGSSVAVVATVRNDASVPGRATLSFASDGRELATRTVRLDAESTREITVPASLGAGTRRLSVGNASTTVDVAPEPTTTVGDGSGSEDGADGRTSTADGAGFAVAGTVAALGALTATRLLARRRRD
jgi:hypothetical protein